MKRGGMHCSWCQGDIARLVLYEADQAWLFGRAAWGGARRQQANGHARQEDRQLIYRERQLTQLTDLGKEVLPMLERSLACGEGVRRKAQEFQRKAVAPLKSGLAPSISVSLVLGPIAEVAKQRVRFKVLGLWKDF